MFEIFGRLRTPKKAKKRLPARSAAGRLEKNMPMGGVLGQPTYGEKMGSPMPLVWPQEPFEVLHGENWAKLCTHPASGRAA